METAFLVSILSVLLLLHILLPRVHRRIPQRRSSVMRPRTKAELDALIASPGVVVVMFMAQWCGHCQRSKPFFEAARPKQCTPGLLACDLLGAENVQTYGVEGCPTYVKYADGKVAGKKVGGFVSSDDVEEFVSQ